jgi:hypothetical protein
LGATPPVTAPSENSRLVVVVADTFRVSSGSTSVAVYDNASLDTEAILLYAILHEKLKYATRAPGELMPEEQPLLR